VNWTSPELTTWLRSTRTVGTRYTHIRLDEDPAHEPEGLDALARLVAEAHSDAAQYIADLESPTLDPLAPQATGSAEPRLDYPWGLHTSTLQGYLGEILSGLIAENYPLHNATWHVPLFLFRFHNSALEFLEKRVQTGAQPHPIPGRSGEDCVAFQLSTAHKIVGVLFCEAKCTHTHDTKLVATGHKQLSDSRLWLPADILQFIGALKERDDLQAQHWVAALQDLLYAFSTAGAARRPRRRDLFVYVCGRTRHDGRPWLAEDKCHKSYRAKRALAAAEVHFVDFDKVLQAAYPRHTITR